MPDNSHYRKRIPLVGGPDSEEQRGVAGPAAGPRTTPGPPTHECGHLYNPRTSETISREDVSREQRRLVVVGRPVGAQAQSEACRFLAEDLAWDLRARSRFPISFITRSLFASMTARSSGSWLGFSLGIRAARAESSAEMHSGNVKLWCRKRSRTLCVSVL